MAKIFFKSEPDEEGGGMKIIMGFLDKDNKEIPDSSIPFSRYLKLINGSGLIRDRIQYGLLYVKYLKSSITYLQCLSIGKKEYPLYHSKDPGGLDFIKTAGAHYYPIIIETNYLDKVFERCR